MNKAQSIHDFWSGFKIPAYDENSVPDNATFPYITYSVVTDSLDYVALLTASIWYRSSSWEDVTLKSMEISEALKDGVVIKLDKGYTYLYRGTPFAQRVKDNDDMIRRIYLNVNVEYLTNN